MPGSHRRESWVDGRLVDDTEAAPPPRRRGRAVLIATIVGATLMVAALVAAGPGVVPAVTAWAAGTVRTAPPATPPPAATTPTPSATAPAPAHLAAKLAAGTRSLTVTWRLDPGGEAVSAVRIIRNGAAEPVVLDRPATSGTVKLAGLTAGRRYTVTVAPVIAGTAGTPVTLAGTVKKAASRTAAASPSASAKAAPSEGTAARVASPSSDDPSGAGLPATPAGWSVLYSQDFTRNASLGSFSSVYPGWASYDGTTDTSRETARPRAKVGIWNSATTSSVHDGVFDCHLWTKGVQPQVCAVTPTPNGQPGQLYGRYSVRFKADPLPGYKIAWLLWPGSNQWSQGEIDFPEGSLDGSITGNVHRVDGDPSDTSYYVDTKARMGSWQTATIDWRPGRVTFLLGDQSWTTTDPRGLPKNPMRWALQAETEIQAAAPDPSVQGHILIDWLVGYRYTG